MSQPTILLTGAPATTPADMPSNAPAAPSSPIDESGQSFDDVLSRQRQATSSRDGKRDAEQTHISKAVHDAVKSSDVRATRPTAKTAIEVSTKGESPTVQVVAATPKPVATSTSGMVTHVDAVAPKEDSGAMQASLATKQVSLSAVSHDPVPKTAQLAAAPRTNPVASAAKEATALAPSAGQSTAQVENRPAAPSPLAEANALSREQAAKTPEAAGGSVANASSTLVTSSPTMVGSQQLTGLDAAEQSSELASSEPTLALTSQVDIPGLVASISRPVLKANGEYSVKVSLHPPQLGEVRAIMTMKGDTLHVVLTPDKSEGHAALQSSLSDLKEQLSRHGGQVDVELGQPGSDGGSDHATPMRTVGVTSSSSTAPAFSPTPAIVESGRVRLVL